MQFILRTKYITKRNLEGKKKKYPIKKAGQKENCESTQENRAYQVFLKWNGISYRELVNRY